MKPVTIALIMSLALGGAASAAEQRMAEDHAKVPMPPGVQVVVTEMEGPVFADARGLTLYIWPQKAMRIGFAGDPKEKSFCEDKPTTKTAGMMSPWPAGLDLPEVDRRLSCAATWPPLAAPDDAKPIGQWTVVTRSDGKKQWAYNKQPVYTSNLDTRAGETNGAFTVSRRGGDEPAEREIVGPPPNVPPGFNVLTTRTGRLVVNEQRYSLYTWDRDEPGKSNCTGDCARVWIPALAPASAQPQGEWTIIQRAPGVRQWAFRKKALYTFSEDTGRAATAGAEVPGWQNVYTQMAPANPSELTVQMTLAGDVLADAKGKTIYTYTCGDDSQDQMSCDLMDSPQVYRIAIAGGGDWDRALKMWPYVEASAAAKAPSLLWSVVWVDPKTGREAQANQEGALRVWAYRKRPVYTYAGDKEPGDMEGNGMGEWQGFRNGFRAFYVRDAFTRRGG
jgi:predicted lipoprotein with Yx(FWY)xxD motif